MHAASANASGLTPASGFAASVLPELHRSEAFVEDLFDSSSFAAEPAAQAAPAGSRWHTVLLCGVPVLVAVLGGVLAFFQGLG